MLVPREFWSSTSARLELITGRVIVRDRPKMNLGDDEASVFKAIICSEIDMKIHEYQSKALFRKAGVAVPEGIVCKTADEVSAAYEKLGGTIAVVKSQIHAGGRGKGRFKEQPDQAGVVL